MTLAFETKNIFFTESKTINASGVGEGILNLPTTQMRLFERIQQKQKQNLLNDDNKSADDDVIPKDENWYSSDEEEKAVKPAVVRTKRWDVADSSKPSDSKPPMIAPPAVVIPTPSSVSAVGPIILPKELTEVLSAIKMAPVVAKEKTPDVEIVPVENKVKVPSRDPR